MSDAPPQPTPHPVRIELLDPTYGRTIQSWEFKDRKCITIGRATDQDIAIADVAVSRQHVELVRAQDGWKLNSLGRHGVTVNGFAVNSVLLGDETLFRLGATGPMLRFILRPDMRPVSSLTEDGQATMATTQMNVLLLEDLETQDRDQKVGEIVNSDFFQLIKEKARELRRSR